MSTGKTRLASAVSIVLMVSSALVVVASLLIALAFFGSAFNVPAGLSSWVFWLTGLGGAAVTLLLGASAALLLYCLGGGLRVLLDLERI